MMLRKHYGYSQSYVAKILGIETIDYMGYENGRSVPSFASIKILATIYHIPVEELFINDRNISLKDEDKRDVDQKNYSYLRRQAQKENIIKYIKSHKERITIIGVMIMFVIVIISFFMSHPQKEILVITENDRDILDVSDMSLVYIKNNQVYGKGDNSNGQLDLDFEDVVAVSEGSTFTVVLKKDGTVDSSGLLKKYADEIKEWSGIVEIAAGNGHIVALNQNGKVLCTGSNAYGQCEFDGYDNIRHIFAERNATIIVDNDGKAYVGGDFIGKSKFKTITGIEDIAISDNIVAYIDDSKRITYYSSHGNYSEASMWRDIVDVAVGNEFIAGLDSEGNVYIDIDNYKIAEEVATWKDIKAIDAGIDYLVAYDGINIYGVGNNAYGQFELSESQKMQLNAVSNIKVTYEEYDLKVSFDAVINATEYLLEMDAGIGVAYRSGTNEFVISYDILEDDKDYTIRLVAVGNDRYMNSDAAIINFHYNKPDDSTPEKTPEPSTPSEVEIPFTLDMLEGKSKTSFENYLKGFGVSDDKMFPEETEIPCSGDEAIILGVTGIGNYQSITKSELLEKEIHYYYCKVGD